MRKTIILEKIKRSKQNLQNATKYLDAESRTRSCKTKKPYTKKPTLTPTVLCSVYIRNQSFTTFWYSYYIYCSDQSFFRTHPNAVLKINSMQLCFSISKNCFLALQFHQLLYDSSPLKWHFCFLNLPRFQRTLIQT